MKLLSNFHNQKGFTLVEMILYVSICSIFLLSLSTFMSFLLSARVRSQAITEVNQQGFQVMHFITSTIRNGRNVEIPAIGVSSSTLSVTTGVPLFDPTVFSVASTTLYIQEGSAVPVALTNSRVNVSALLFQNISSGSSTEKIIRFSFIVTHKNQSGRDEYNFAKTFSGSATLR